MELGFWRDAVQQLPPYIGKSQHPNVVRGIFDTISHYEKGWGRQVNSIFEKTLTGGRIEIEYGHFRPGHNLSCKVS